MVALSQELAAFRAPLSGMDTRRLRSPESPNILFNVDMSLDGSWRERPGLKLAAVRSGRVVGLHAMEVGENFVLIALIAVAGNGMFLYAYSERRDSTSLLLTPIFFEHLTAEPYQPHSYYDFAQAGRFLYFCNGVGLLHELEWVVGTATFNITAFPYEAGLSPRAFSYVNGQISPSSLEFFYDQIVVSGFGSSRSVPITNPLDNEQSEVPERLIANTRDAVSIVESNILVSEPAMFRSYPMDDMGGMYFFFDQEILATSNVADILLVFTRKALFRVVGHGTTTPKREWVSDLTLVSPRAITRIGALVFFVSESGCYVTDGSSVTKVSDEMDPLWFSRYRPDVTRETQRRLRKTAYPFFVNRRSLDTTICINDRERKQVMVAIPASGFVDNNMMWVWNYDEFLKGGAGKWSIWAGKEEPLTGNSGVVLPATGTNSPLAGSPTNVFHALSMTVRRRPVSDTIYVGGPTGGIYTLTDAGRPGGEGTDYPNISTGPTPPKGTPIAQGYPVLVGLGRVGRTDPDGRTVYTDIAIRHLQRTRNVSEDENVGATDVIIRSEGEAQRLINANNADVEDTKQTPNMQFGTSQETTSVLGQVDSSGASPVWDPSNQPGITLGDAPTGSASPLMGSEYMESYGRINAPDDEARTITVDIVRDTVNRPQRFDVTEVRIYGSVKGGSQRDPS